MQIILNWPQMIVLFLYVLGLGISAAEHGKPKTGTHSFFIQLFSTLFSMFLLYEGGFF